MLSEHSEIAHVDEAVLIRLLDGELSRAEARRVKAHLRSCWSCRHRADSLYATVSQFVEVCDGLTEEIAPPANWSGFRSRLQAQIAKKTSPSRRTISPQWLTTASAALIVGWWLFTPEAKPALQATELLNQSTLHQQKSRTQAGGRIIHQRLEVSAANGGRSVWDVWHAPNRGRSRQRWSGEENIAERARDAYGRLGMQDPEPLSASAFSRWRDSVTPRSEQIERSRETLTLHTQPASGELLSASLTVRASDWHPVEQQLRFAESTGIGEIRVREVSYAIIQQQDAPGDFLDEPAPPVQSLPQRKPKPVDPALLEISEATLREALHKLELDISLSPVISREPNAIRLDLIVEAPQTRTLLLGLLEGVPYLQLNIRTPDEASASSARAGTRVQFASPRLYRTEPPSAHELATRLGSAADAAAYTARVHAAFRAALVPALALEELGARYPEAVFAGLPEAARGSVDRLAASYSRAARRRSEDLSRSLDVALSLLGPVRDTASIAVSVPWQSAARILVTRLRRVDAAFNRLFVTHELVLDGTEDPGRGDLTALERDLRAMTEALRVSSAEEEENVR